MSATAPTPTPETSRVVEINGLNKYYGRGRNRNHVIKDLSLQIHAGELLAIVGTSGSGKTTLLNILGGLDRDYEGSVEIDGQELRSLSDRRLSRLRNQTMGFIFQSFNLLPHITCLENIMVPAYFSSSALAESRRRARDLVELVGLRDKANDRPTELSGGQKQRVAIARAMFSKPSIILCDEPTGSLDQSTSVQILTLFHALNHTEGATFVLVTHDEKVSGACQRVIRLEDGCILSDHRQVPVLPDASSHPQPPMPS